MTTTVTANDEQDRYEISVDHELAGYAEFVVDGEVAIMPHTEIRSEYEGQGLATELIRQTLDDARSRSLKIIDRCRFVREFIDENPEYQDLRA